MMNSRVLSLVGIGFTLLTAPGCIIIADGEAHWGTHVWRESSEELQLASAGLAELEVRGQSGEVSYEGQGATPAVNVVARKRGGGRTVESAEEALAAIEVYSEDRGGGVQQLGWRWREDRYRGWQGSVAFSITGPASVALDVETHNGEVVVEGVSGEVAIVTHNGQVRVEAAGPKLAAETHNGAIEATFAGESVSLVTHNGGIGAALIRPGPVGGKISTNNGGIELSVADGLASELECSTRNGRIRVKVPNSTTESGDQRVRATIGGGGPPLAISTHNGSIKVQPVKG